MSIANKMDKEIEKIEIQRIVPISDDQIREILNTLKNIDRDLKPLLDTIIRLLDEIDDQAMKTYTLIRILKFYGFKNDDILSTRQKFVIVDGRLVKNPFLNEHQKECINILLEELEVTL